MLNSTLYNSSGASPSANAILYHLRTKFEPDRLERVANTLLRRDTVELLPEQVEVRADLHLRPYYGDEDDTDAFYHSSEAWNHRVPRLCGTLRTRERCFVRY